MIISIALSDFYYWKKKFNINNELEYLKIIKKLNIDGIEIHTTEKEILNNDILRFRHKINKLFVTIHLPLFKESKEFYTKLKLIKKTLNVHYFIIHATEYNKLKKPPMSIPFLIENSDKRKRIFKNTKDLLKFSHDFCFDINHSKENYNTISSIKKQYNYIKKRVKEFHISTIYNPIYSKYNYNTHHKLITRSNQKVPSLYKKKANIVIEGLIPINRLDLLAEEIKLIKSEFKK